MKPEQERWMKKWEGNESAYATVTLSDGTEFKVPIEKIELMFPKEEK